MYNGKTKQIKKYLDFLETKYNMCFSFQSFNEYHGFAGPSDCYSFYNDNGCFTIHNLAQKGEWGIFVCDKFSNSQYSLLTREIDQSEYGDTPTIGFILTSSWLNYLSKIIKREIALKNSFFGIKI